jgi:CHAT domain-containing protein
MVMKRSAVEVRRRTANVSAIRARLDAMNFQVGRAISRGIPGGARGARLAEDVEHELATLGELILAPILDAISGVERIAFVPAGPVHGVPLGALRVNGERLMSRTSTTISPSASVLCHLPPRRGARALIVGVADEHAPRAEDEARVVAQGVPGALLLCGASATRGEVSRAMTGAGLVHIASHARFIASNPGASGVKLADGWLTARDIMSINLAGAEVVLSGCDTGRAVVKGGDEVLGLTRAFLAAGASMLVQTLWALHDESAARIMARAYGVGYGEGALRGERRFGLGEGIRRAQVEEERSDRHAAAWAGFVTVGAPW